MLESLSKEEDGGDDAAGGGGGGGGGGAAKRVREADHEDLVGQVHPPRPGPASRRQPAPGEAVHVHHVFPRAHPSSLSLVPIPTPLTALVGWFAPSLVPTPFPADHAPLGAPP